MKLDNVKNFLMQLSAKDIPISNTSKGEQIHQTYRNQLTAQLKDALFEDCLVNFPFDDENGIFPYRVKEGVILEVPNASIADKITNEYGSGAISVELKFTVKDLDYNAEEMAEDYDCDVRRKASAAAEREKKKSEQIKRSQAARAAREAKRAKLIATALRQEE